jgi:hypothetical protein
MKIGNKYPQASIEYDTWEKIYETVLTSTSSSISITGLEGNTDEQYILDIDVVASGAIGWVFGRLNGDTGSNYGIYSLYGNSSTISSSQGTSNTALYLTYANTDAYKCSSSNIIFAKSGYVRTILGTRIQDITSTTVSDIVFHGQVWNNTASELTSISIYTGGNNFGIGSSFSLYRRISQ